MATSRSGVRVRLDPQDEYTHPIEAAQNFNESMYFNVFDRAGRIGGWFRLANRPNEGRGEMSCCIYLPDGRIGFMFARPECKTNDAFAGAGMSFDVTEPFKRVSVRYRGKLCVMTNAERHGGSRVRVQEQSGHSGGDRPRIRRRVADVRR